MMKSNDGIKSESVSLLSTRSTLSDLGVSTWREGKGSGAFLEVVVSTGSFGFLLSAE